MINTSLNNIKELNFPIVGGNTFGRYPKISTEETFNMMISDSALVPFSGYRRVTNFSGVGEGRGLYASTKYNHLIAVVDRNVYSISSDESVSFLFQLKTESGDVYISENDGNQIGIADGLYIYTFNYSTNIATTVTNLDFLPIYLSFQDGYFISCGPTNNGQVNRWILSGPNDGNDWTPSSNTIGALQSKPDYCVAVQPFNRQLYVFGKNVTEIWYDVGYNLFPYQRNNYYYVDYGCLNPATIATGSILEGENLVPLICWLGINEKSGPTIMYSVGGQPTQLSTDGINFKIEQLTNPENCYAFIARQAGHTYYQITWPDDNLSYIYDFNVKQFFTVTDENLNHHIAKRLAFFNNKYYFLSFDGGSLYETSNQYYTYDGKIIPRIRILPPIRLPDASRFVCSCLNITMLQGNSDAYSVVDISVSKDGGQSYSNIPRKDIRFLPNRPNIFRYWGLGSANDWRFQLRCYGATNFVLTNGTMGIYQ